MRLKKLLQEGASKERVYFGSPAHFICARDCRFHIATLVGGKYMVSTVGEYWPDRKVRGILAGSRNVPRLMENEALKGDAFDAAYMEKFGYEEIGYDRKYETMVFEVTGKVCEYEGCDCGLPEIIPSEIGFAGYNNAKDANEGHERLCREWESKP